MTICILKLYFFYPLVWWYKYIFDILASKHQSLKESKANISEDSQQKHFEIVFELMQKMQSYGNPPADIVGEFGKFLAKFWRLGDFDEQVMNKVSAN